MKLVLTLTAAGICFAGVAALRLGRGNGTARPQSFVQLTRDGRYKTNIRTDGNQIFFNEFEVFREVLKVTTGVGGAIRTIATGLDNVELQDIASDGRTLLVTSFEGTELEKPLWFISVSGGKPMRIGDAYCRLARWAHDNRLIACATNDLIELITPQGEHFRRLGPFQGAVINLLWATDDQKLRFVLQNPLTREFTGWEIAVNANGLGVANAAMLPFGQDCCLDWAWAGDRNRFLYLKYEPKPVLRYTSADQSGQLNIEVETITAFVSSPRKPALLMLIQNSNLGGLLKFDPKKNIFATTLHGLSAEYLSFSRDGQWMTYTDCQDSSLWRSRVDGSDALRLTDPGLEVELSSWSPDGQSIVFMGRERGRVWRIYRLNRDGGVPEELAKGKDSQGAPTFSPDGRAVVYGNVDCYDTQTCWIRVLSLESRITETLPGSHGLRTARWSPDGRYIAAFHPENHELMLFDVSRRRWKVLADSVTGDNINWSSDSKYVYADSPQAKKPVIERFRVIDGQRTVVVSLATLQKIPGQLDFWFGLTPDQFPILLHRFTASEVYLLE
jgi:WD40 repeat protein